MWVKRLDSIDSEFRYEVYSAYSDELIQVGGKPTTLFTIVRYFKNDKGEWERCKFHASACITIEALMNDFILIDSPIHKELQKLREFQKSTYAKNLEESLAPFCLNKAEEVDDNIEDEKSLNGTVTNMDNNGND